MISLGRISPATFALRYKAELLPCGIANSSAAVTQRGFNSLWLLVSFQMNFDHRLLTARNLRHNSGYYEHSDSAPDSILFIRHYSGPPCWFLLLPIMICLSSRGNLLLSDATVRIRSNRIRWFIVEPHHETHVSRTLLLNLCRS